MPMELTLKERRRRGQTKEAQEQKGKKGKEVIIWNKETIEKYKERTETLYERAVKKDTDTIEEKWERIKWIVHEAIVKKKIKIKEK